MVGAVSHRDKAEAVTTDYGAVLDNHTISQPAAFADDRVSVQDHVVSQRNKRVKGCMGMKRRVGANYTTYAYDHVRADARAGPNPGIVGNHS